MSERNGHPDGERPTERSEVLTILVLALIAVALVALVLTARAAPVPFPRAARPLDDAALRKWLSAGVTMQWRGITYAARFDADGNYGALATGNTTGWSGPWRFERDEAGRRWIVVREWYGPLPHEGPGLEWSFPAEVITEGKIGGTMPGGGECWLSKEK